MQKLRSFEVLSLVRHLYVKNVSKVVSGPVYRKSKQWLDRERLMPTPLFCICIDDAKPRIDRHHTNDVHGILIPGNHIFEMLPPKHIVINFADCRFSQSRELKRLASRCAKCCSVPKKELTKAQRDDDSTTRRYFTVNR